MDSTRTIDDQIMINHATAVKKAAEKSLVFFDLPYSRDFSEANTVKRVLSIMKKYKINDDVRIFCDKYNKKSLKILKLFEGYQKDLFINLLIVSINRTY